MKKFSVILLLFLSTFSLKVKADEGMWLLPLIEKLNIGTMTDLGFKLTSEDIYSVNQACIKDAVVMFGGGCTAEIVSPEGLLLTNHHCGYSYIQSHSSIDHDYLTDGFWAMSRQEELPNPGLSVYFLVDMEDVTVQVLDGVTNDMSESARESKMRSNMESIIEKAEEGNSYTADIESFYSDNYFYLLR